MFDTVIEFFNNWKDACVYASECGVNGMPGSEFFGDSEFYLTLGTIMGVCWTIWFVNERKITKRNQIQAYWRASKFN